MSHFASEVRPRQRHGPVAATSRTYVLPVVYRLLLACALALLGLVVFATAHSGTAEASEVPDVPQRLSDLTTVVDEATGAVEELTAVHERDVSVTVRTAAPSPTAPETVEDDEESTVQASSDRVSAVSRASDDIRAETPASMSAPVIPVKKVSSDSTSVPPVVAGRAGLPVPAPVGMLRADDVGSGPLGAVDGGPLSTTDTSTGGGGGNPGGGSIAGCADRSRTTDEPVLIGVIKPTSDRAPSNDGVEPPVPPD